MLIQFLGCPSSGKTTTASGVFFQLKKHGFNSEFITEQARCFIAKKKANLGKGEVGLRLTGSDQISIFDMQKELEDNFVKSLENTDGIIVADSSCINTLLYLSDEEIDKLNIVNSLKNRFSNMDVKFYYCKPTSIRENNDPNRLHSTKESQILDERLQYVLGKYFPELKVCVVQGDPVSRVDQVMIDLISSEEE